MKLSEKQFLMLLDIAKFSLITDQTFGGYTYVTRQQLVNDLINQQSNDLTNIETVDYKKELNKKLVLNG